MKMVKLFLVGGVLLFSMQAMADVGPMARSDIRDGQLICPKILAKQEADRKAALAQSAANNDADSAAVDQASAI